MSAFLLSGVLDPWAAELSIRRIRRRRVKGTFLNSVFPFAYKRAAAQSAPDECQGYHAA